MTVQDVDVAQKFWGKDTSELKVKTTHRKPNVVARDQVKIPVEIINLHKEVFLKITFFCDQDSILPNVKSEDLFHEFQSPLKPHSLGNIQGLQVDLSLLPTSCFLNHNGAFGWRVRAFEDPDRVPTKWSTGKPGCIKQACP